MNAARARSFKQEFERKPSRLTLESSSSWSSPALRLAVMRDNPNPFPPALAFGGGHQTTSRTNLAELLADPGSSGPAIIATTPLEGVSYKALAEQIEKLTGELINAGRKPGMSVARVLPNTLEFLV